MVVVRRTSCLFFVCFSFLPSPIMSYHREWDRGKDDSYQTGSVRDREEDYYNDNKRRKFNNGVCLSFSPCSTSVHPCYRPMTPPTPTTTTDTKIGRKNLHKMIVHGEVLADLSRSGLFPLNRVPTSSSLVWIQTSQRPMSVDSHVLELFYIRD